MKKKEWCGKNENFYFFPIKMNKRRRFDENVVSDSKIVDFLDRNPFLYKNIQLSTYLDELTNNFIIPFNIGSSSLIEMCTSIMYGIQGIIRRVFPDVIFCDHEEERGSFKVLKADGVVGVEFLLYKLGVDIPDTLLEICTSTMQNYLNFLSQKISMDFGIHTLVSLGYWYGIYVKNNNENF